MRYAASGIVLALASAVVVLACSSSDDKTNSADAGGAIVPVTGGGSDDGDAGCMGVKSLDCTKQAAHAKDGNCSKYDEKTFTSDCESLNCDTPPACAGQLKAYGDCLVEHPVTCTSDGAVDTTATPTECKDADSALFNCQTSG